MFKYNPSWFGGIWGALILRTNLFMGASRGTVGNFITHEELVGKNRNSGVEKGYGFRFPECLSSAWFDVFHPWFSHMSQVLGQDVHDQHKSLSLGQNTFSVHFQNRLALQKMSHIFPRGLASVLLEVKWAVIGGSVSEREGPVSAPWPGCTPDTIGSGSLP